MTNSKSLPFGLQRDGSIDRRGFLRTAGRLGVGAFGLSSLGLASAARAADPFNIGWIRPTTGRLASSFSYLYIGGLIAIEEINAAGGILGRPIARIEEDDEASPAKEPAIVKKLQGSGINFIAGPTGSSQSLSSLATTTPAKIIQATYANGAEAGRRHELSLPLPVHVQHQPAGRDRGPLSGREPEAEEDRHPAGEHRLWRAGDGCLARDAEKARARAGQGRGLSAHRTRPQFLCRQPAQGRARRPDLLDRQRAAAAMASTR